MSTIPSVTAKRSETGSVLVIAVIFVIALAGLAMGLAGTTVEESQANENFGQIQRVTYLAETGVNHAMSDITTGGSGNIGSKSVPIDFGGGTYYVTATPQGNDIYTLVSRARLGTQQRAIEVVVGPKEVPIFAVAMFSDADFTANGTVLTDSYDSDAGLYADQAKNVHPDTGETFAKPGGDIGTNGNMNISGTVVIMGSASTGPGGSLTLGKNVWIEGSTAPSFMARPLPEAPFDPPVPVSGDLRPGARVPVTLTAGDYHFDDLILKTDNTVTISGDVRLWVDDAFTMGSKSEIVLEPGATLKIYHNGPEFDLTGQGVLNKDQEPQNLMIFTRATHAKFTGGSGFYGAIYAPNALLEPVGTTDMFGALVGKEIKIGGTAVFHYDEGLRDTIAKMKRFSVYSWRKAATIED